MSNNMFKRLEETFFDYTKKYDENIKILIKKRGVEISTEELDEILHDAKNMTVV